MTLAPQSLVLRWLGRTASVPVANCVHFGGWRYGCGGFNPYENYVATLATKSDAAAARADFIDFLRYFRPRHFGEALGMSLAREQPLWQFPWAVRRAPPAWKEEPNECPDILTHFSSAGILLSRVEQEFQWLENTFGSIRDLGYRPDRFAGFPCVRRLIAATGDIRCLVLDGNHRIAALAALGIKEVRVRYLRMADVHERRVRSWRGVANGSFSEEEARSILRRYLVGTDRIRTVAEPAPLIHDVALPR